MPSSTKIKPRKWSRVEVRSLVRLYHAQVPARKIASRLNRTTESIESKLYAMRKSGELGSRLVDLTVNKQSPVEEITTLVPVVEPTRKPWWKFW